MSHRFERPCALAPGAATALAVKWLQAHGYQLGSSRDGEAHLVHAVSHHRLEVRADGQTLSFAFSGEHESPEKLEALLARVSAELGSGVGAPMSAPKSTRCPACSSEQPAGATRCDVCGTRL